ncbi:peptidoglycan-binding protein [Evansella clarkii]|uniref:peptidoglycan-binding protein n=1 Tax=Evansella clarkii TaxID=79879 RepID=UPI001C4782EF|nr:peptidoglycan-binding protein [Evansella clarkii]
MIKRILIYFLISLILLPANMSALASGSENDQQASVEIEPINQEDHLEGYTISINLDTPVETISLYAVDSETGESVGLINKWEEMHEEEIQFNWDLTVFSVLTEEEYSEKRTYLPNNTYYITLLTEKVNGEEEDIISTVTETERIFIDRDLPSIEFSEEHTGDSIIIEQNSLYGMLGSSFPKIDSSIRSFNYSLVADGELYNEGEIPVDAEGNFSLKGIFTTGESTLNLFIEDLAGNNVKKTFSVKLLTTGLESEENNEVSQEETNNKSEAEENAISTDESGNQSDSITIDEEKEDIIPSETRDETIIIEESENHTPEETIATEEEATISSFSMNSQAIMSEEFQFGDRNERIVDFKHDLMKLGFGTHWTNPTTYFGPDTEKVVRQLQEYYGLAVTGKGDQATLQKMNEVLSSPFQFGARSSDVQSLKEDLMRIGFGTHWTNPTTYFGSDTEKVVREFQETNSLAVNGIADEVTLRKIEELLPQSHAPNVKLEFGTRHQSVVDFKHDLMSLGFGTHWSNPTTYFGPDTEKVVREFQRYYGLSVNGRGDQATLNKINEVLSSPLQLGKRSNEVQSFKQDLMKAGFGTHWSNPTTYFGSDTERVVREFQKANGLAVSGIGEEVTLRKVQELQPPTLEFGARHQSVVDFKRDLMSLGFGTHWSNPTTYFGPDTEKVVREFQSYYGLSVNGRGDQATLNKINEVLSSPLQLGARSSEVQSFKQDLMKAGFGAHWSNPTTYYGSDTERVVREFQKANGLAVNGIADAVTVSHLNGLLTSSERVVYTPYNLTLAEALNIQLTASPQTTNNYNTYVSKSHINNNNEVTATTLNVRGGPGTNYWIVGQLSRGDRVSVIGETNGWYQIHFTNTRQFVNAKPEDVMYYLDPTNFINDERARFQFLDLSKSSGASATVLNAALRGKGILENQGQAFIDAGRAHGVNELYLISHAILETGHGTSQLASGVRYNGVTVYNMYGVGAFDHCPVECGAREAFDRGWTSPYLAIIGGAEFIGNRYIQAGQNTLYKMRWNPAAMQGGTFGRQYATDIGWASKQVGNIFNLYQQVGTYNLHLDIPQYR